MRSLIVVIEWGSLAFFAGVFAILVRGARAQRRMTTELAAFLASMSIAWLEAVLDWGAFLYYSTAWSWDFPGRWPIVRLIPVFPVACVMAYTWFFFGSAWLCTRLSGALRRRRPYWDADHTTLITTFGISFGISAIAQNICLMGGILTYTQTWAPFTVRAGTDTQWPLTMDLAMALTITPLAYLMDKRNDRNEDLLQASVRCWSERRSIDTASRAQLNPVAISAAVGRRPATPSVSSGRRRSRGNRPFLTLGAWVLALHAIYLPVSLAYCTLRWIGWQTSVSTVRPYPDGRPLFDGDVTRPGDPTINSEPIARASNSRR